MKTLLTTILLGIFLSSSLVLFAQKEGDAAPNFSLKNLKGDTITLSELEDEVVVLFLLGNNCPLCRGVAPRVESEVHQAYKDQGVRVLGLDLWTNPPSTTTSVGAFQSQTGVTFDLLLQASTYSSSFPNNPITYDRIMVLDKDKIIRFKGSRPVSSDLTNAKNVIAQLLEQATSNEEEAKPFSTRLLPNYPNPFNPSTTISFQLENNSLVSVGVYDLMGRQVESLLNSQLSAGTHSVAFSSGTLSSGNYVVRMEVGGQIFTQMISLVK